MTESFAPSLVRGTSLPILVVALALLSELASAQPASEEKKAAGNPGTGDRPAVPATVELDAFGHFRASRAAGRRGDFAAEIEHLEAAQRLVGSEPVFAFELARACSRAGRIADALRWLEPAVHSGEAFKVDSDPAFAALHGQAGLEKLLPAILASRQPIGQAEIKAKLGEKDLLPEGIAWDAETGDLFVSSTYRRKIVRIRPDGTASDFTRGGQDGLWGVVGLAVDAKRRLLWAAHGNVGPGMPMDQPDAASTGSTGLFAFDLKTGEVRRRIRAGGPGEPRFFNALALRPSDGAVFVSDSLQGVFRLDKDHDTPVQLLSTRNLTFPNGIALSADEQRLYIAHLEGLLMLELASGKTTQLLAPPGQPGVAGIDGLSFADGALIGVLPSMYRVVRWQLAADGTSISASRILLAHHPAMKRPTTGVAGDGTFYLIANAQLQSHNGDGTLFPLDQLQEPTILAIPLNDAQNLTRSPR